MTLTGTPIDHLIVLFAGVVVSFTPCLYPVLPVVATTVVGVNASGTRWGGFFLSGLYVLGLAFSYSLLAVAASLGGKVFGAVQNDPWMLLVVANIILIFALAMLDVITIPSLAFGAPVKKRGKLALFMGMVSGLIVGPCTAPVLGTILLVVASQKDVLWGISLMFTFALGLGMTALLVGTFSGLLAALPRSGVWMVWVKKAAGIVLLLLAEYYLLRAGALFGL